MSNEKKNQALTDCNSKDWIELYGHEYAEVLFEQDPSKAFQRHIREMYEEADPRPKIESFDGAVVEEVSYAEAKEIIERYEWLGNLPQRTAASYGLRIGGELVAVVCFGLGGSPEARQIVEPDPDHYWRDRGFCWKILNLRYYPLTVLPRNLHEAFSPVSALRWQDEE